MGSVGWCVEAVIERPPAPPWIGDLPYPQLGKSWPGTMLGWRRTDKQAGMWTALVPYRRDGLTYSHWVSGHLLEVEPEQTAIPSRPVFLGLPEAWDGAGADPSARYALSPHLP